jgi:hypothetical protein
MKKFKLVQIALFLAVAAMTFASCSKDKDDDPRDQFVGSYSYTMTGSIKMTAGTDVETISLQESGNMTITKSLDANKVMITDDGETTEYLVSGNTLTASYQETVEGVTMQMSETGILIGNTLTFTVTGSGSLTMGDVSMGVTVNIVLTCTKR